MTAALLKADARPNHTALERRAFSARLASRASRPAERSAPTLADLDCDTRATNRKYAREPSVCRWRAVMNRLFVVILASGLFANSQAAIAETHYMYCFGGGRPVYFSAVFPVPESTRGRDKEPAFNAFVKDKYGTMIHAECHRDQTKANSESAKKLQEDSMRNAKPTPFNVVETGWAG
jgi:hypothetical protein